MLTDQGKEDFYTNINVYHDSVTSISRDVFTMAVRDTNLDFYSILTDMFLNDTKFCDHENKRAFTGISVWQIFLIC